MAQLSYENSPCVIRRLADGRWWAGIEFGFTSDVNIATPFEDLKAATDAIEENIDGDPGQFLTIYWKNTIQYV
jgi:hypothetical protein